MKTKSVLAVFALMGGLAGWVQGRSPVLSGQLQGFARETGQPGLAQAWFEPPVREPQAQEILDVEGRVARVSDEELEQTLTNIGYIDDPHERNRAIEKCFVVNKHRLSWPQVKRLLGAVSATDYDSAHTYDKGNSIQRIVAQYLELWPERELDPATAVEAAQWNRNDPHEVNAQIEKYFYAHPATYLDELETLLEGLRYTDYDIAHTHDRSNVIARLTTQFLRTRGHLQLPAEAVKTAQWNGDAHKVNELIESYFYANRDRFAQSDVEILLQGLRFTDYDSAHTYDRGATGQRIVRAWGCPLCIF